MVNAVKILIEAEDKATKTIDTVNESLVDLWKESKTVGQTMTEFGERNKETFQSMAVSWGVAFAGITAGAKLAVDAFAESQAQLVRVDQIIKNTDLSSVGLSFDEASQAARKFWDNLQNSVGISGELAAESYAKLLQVTKDQTQAQKLATLAADLSVAKQMDMWSATKVVTMALAGNQKILKEYGIEVSDTATQQEIMGALMEKVGWQAAAFWKTVEWQSAIFKETFGDLQEAVGGALAPAFTQLLAVVQPLLLSFAAWANENPEIVAWIIWVGGALAWLVSVIGVLWLAIPSIVAWFAAIKVAMIAMTWPVWIVIAILATLAGLVIANRDTIKSAFTSWVEYIYWVIEPFVTWITNARSTMTQGLTMAWDAARQWISDTFGTYGEYLMAIFNAFKALFSGDFQWFVDNIRLAWELWLTMMRNFLTTIGTAILWIAKTLRANIKIAFTDWVNWIRDLFIGAKDAIAGGFMTMLSWLEAVSKSIFNGIVAVIEGFINKAINAFNKLISAANNIWGISIPLIPTLTLGRLAHGGIAGEWYFGGKTMSEQWYATGGVVKWPAGNDMVPAMLTAGEVVLNAAQQRNLASQLGGGQGQVVNLYVSGNNFYWSDDEFAERIGDTFMEKFKLMASFESF